MTQASSNFTPQSLLDDLVQTARDRAARGTATAADWRAVADIDEERARHELALYLQQTTSANEANPFERQPASLGTISGFIGAMIVVALFWHWGVPYLQDAWAGIHYGPGFATALTYVVPLLLPFGALLGSRWDRARRVRHTMQPQAPKGTFDELLRRFVRAQNGSRTRVY